MTNEQEREYQRELEKVPVLLREAYLKGRREEKKEWVSYLPPETLEIRIRARGEDDVDNILIRESFVNLRQGKADLVEYLLKKTYQKLAHESKIIQEVITPEAPHYQSAIT